MRQDIEQGLELAQQYKCHANMIKRELREIESMLLPSESVVFVCFANASIAVSTARGIHPTFTNMKPGMFMLTNKRVLHLGITMGMQEFHQVLLSNVLSVRAMLGVVDALVFEYANGSLSVNINKKAANKIISVVNELQDENSVDLRSTDASSRTHAPASELSFLFCKHCGKKISSDSIFCKFCGGRQD